MKIKFQKGFSLIETILVLAVATVVAFLSIQKQARDAEYATADLAGQQLQFISNAFNGYIAANYGEFVTYTGGGTDPVDSCTYSGANVCEVGTTPANFTAAFITPGYMPVGSTPATPYLTGAGATINYHFYVRTVGVAPNIYAEGLIITDGPLNLGGANPRYDLIGELLSNAGITAGEIPSATVSPGGQFVTISGAYTLSGGGGLNFIFPPGATNGSWGNYLKFQQYSEFLRRDGTLPMTGNLNMGGQNPEVANVGHLDNTNAVNSPTGDQLTLYGDNGVTVNTNGNNLVVTSPNSVFSGNIIAPSGTITAGGNITSNAGNIQANAGSIIAEGASASLQVNSASITNPSGTVARFNGAIEADDLFLRNRGGIALSVALPYYSSRGAFLVQDGSTIALPNCSTTPSSGATPAYPSDDSAPTGIGSAKIILTPANILALGITDNETFETGVTFIAEADTTSSPGNWTIHLETTDPQTGSPYQAGQGIAHVYCVYGN